MATPPLTGAPRTEPPAGSSGQSISVNDGGQQIVRREVEHLPDGRRITYYSREPA